MQWYQPTNTRYQYRTLVNSHLTWLVEFSWLGRFGYLFGWGLILAIVFKRAVGTDASGGKKAKRQLEKQQGARCSAGIATGIWVSFAVSMFFSSVAESWVLWILPLGSLLWMLLPIRALKTGQSTRAGFGMDLLVMAVVSCGALAIAALIGMSGDPAVSVHHDGSNVILGTHPPQNLLLRPDEQVLGQHYGIHLRDKISTGEGWMIANEWPKNTVPEGIGRIVISGDYPDFPENFDFQGELVLFNSVRTLNKSRQNHPGRAILGSFRKDPIAKSIRFACKDEEFGWNLELIKGKKLYLGNWMELLDPTEKHF